MSELLRRTNEEAGVAEITVDELYVNVAPNRVDVDRAYDMAEVEYGARQEAIAILEEGEVDGREKYAVQARVFGVLLRAAIMSHEIETAGLVNRVNAAGGVDDLASKFDENLMRIRERARIEAISKAHQTA